MWLGICCATTYFSVYLFISLFYVVLLAYIIDLFNMPLSYKI